MLRTRSANCQLGVWFYRCFCSKVNDAPDLKRWFDNLSPEMQAKKKRVENEVKLLQEKYYSTNLQLRLHDLEYFMLKCETLEDKKRYFDLLQRKKRATDTKELENMTEQEIASNEHKDGEKIYDPKVYGVFKNSISHPKQKERTARHRSAMSVLNSPLPIVFDLDFDMDEVKERHVLNQIAKAAHFNRCFPEPCAIHVTSYQKNKTLEPEMGTRNFYTYESFMTYHEDGFETVFPREKLVYLTPDGRNLMDHTPGDIYVIGGFEESFGRRPLPVTIKKARDLGIRYGSIPFSKYGIRS